MPSIRNIGERARLSCLLSLPYRSRIRGTSVDELLCRPVCFHRQIVSEDRCCFAQRLHLLTVNPVKAYYMKGENMSLSPAAYSKMLADRVGHTPTGGNKYSEVFYFCQASSQ